jgi:prepilin-type N-terminal cleavage/methylation domain-containing protein
MQSFRLSNKKGGFSLVELTIVVVILGVLATFAVPRFMKSVERSKAGEAFNYLENIVTSQGTHNARTGTYASSLTTLDVELKAPKYFTVGTPTSTAFQTAWELKLTRTGTSSGYGAYTVVFDQNGFNQSKSTIPADLIPNN